uniref:G_PROTEIN_RECEP_F1_2 domain-containing protein n=1 Tax=Heterorhabditis bacteriophora TaxID=37862 RepID=A0A1I7WER5_HETBA
MYRNLNTNRFSLKILVGVVLSGVGNMVITSSNVFSRLCIDHLVVGDSCSLFLLSSLRILGLNFISTQSMVNLLLMDSPMLSSWLSRRVAVFESPPLWNNCFPLVGTVIWWILHLLVNNHSNNKTFDILLLADLIPFPSFSGYWLSSFLVLLFLSPFGYQPCPLRLAILTLIAICRSSATFRTSVHLSLCHLRTWFHRCFHTLLTLIFSVPRIKSPCSSSFFTSMNDVNSIPSFGSSIFGIHCSHIDCFGQVTFPFLQKIKKNKIKTVARGCNKRCLCIAKRASCPNKQEMCKVQSRHTNCVTDLISSC